MLGDFGKCQEEHFIPSHIVYIILKTTALICARLGGMDFEGITAALTYNSDATFVYMIKLHLKISMGIDT